MTFPTRPTSTGTGSSPVLLQGQNSECRPSCLRATVVGCVGTGATSDDGASVRGPGTKTTVRDTLESHTTVVGVGL